MDYISYCYYNNTSLYTISVGDITLSSFSSLSGVGGIPAGATINGIEIDIEGAGNPTVANIPQMKVYYGTSWSSGFPFSGQFVKAGGTLHQVGVVVVNCGVYLGMIQQQLQFKYKLMLPQWMRVVKDFIGIG